MDNPNELYHHGILGQKWGVRRFQNKDGTRTAAGKKRERGEDESQSKLSIDKKTVAKGVAVAAGVGTAAALAINPTTRGVLLKYGKLGVEKALPVAKETGKQAGQAMLKAALASVGSIAVSKIAQKLDPGPNATEAQKNASKVATDAVSAGIRSATNSNGAHNGGSNHQSNPNLKVDKGSKEYQELFSGIDSSEERDLIKDRANKGATIEELRAFKKELGHSEISGWDDLYTYLDNAIRG